jgi:hypothetical protein
MQKKAAAVESHGGGNAGFAEGLLFHSHVLALSEGEELLL